MNDAPELAPTSQQGAASLGPRALRLASLLEAAPGRTVTLAALWSLWARADPASAGSPSRRADLAWAVDQLALAGLVTPSGKVDTTARPHLPVRLTLPPGESAETAAVVAQGVIWRPELAWVLGSRLTISQVEQLQLINSWIRDRSQDTDVLPLRERSLEMLGDEKALDRLVPTSLFAPGRLTLAMLRTVRTHPPLASTRVGGGPVLLVVENDNTFFSIVEVLKNIPAHRTTIGHVAWGCGGAFEASVRSCRTLPGVERVAYFGDVDADGLRIPTNAAQTAAREQLPPVRPATALYNALLRTSVRSGGQPLVAAEQAAALAAWLSDDSAEATVPGIDAQVAELLEQGVRIPQEALNLTLLRSEADAVHGTWLVL
jgi:hypothetical protein